MMKLTKYLVQWTKRVNIMTENSHNANMTQKEMILLVLDGQQKINDRVDQLHEKVNTKISRSELSGWLVAVSALVVLVQAVM